MCFCSLYNSCKITLFNCRAQSVKIQQVSFGN
nr:MAG TPA: hypothetical protein [Caudoviricetes sp.]